MKVFNIVFAILFLLFAYVQVNDPDPILWIVIYLNMTAICTVAVFRKLPGVWLYLTAGAYFVYACFLIPGSWEWFQSPDRSLLFDDIAKMQYPYIEETREFLGLVICLLVLLVLFLLGRRKNTSDNRL